MLGFRRCTSQTLLMAGVVALLAGCGIVAPEPTSTPAPSRTSRPTASPTPTAAPTPTATATAEALVLSTAGLGPIRMGSPVPETGGAPVRWDPVACPGEGLWVATDPIAGQLSVEREQPFGLRTRNGDRTGPVQLLQVWSSQYRTPSGLHVGSTDAAVRTALPRASVLQSEVSRAYSVVSGGWRITLTVADSDGSVLSEEATVQIISVYPASDPETSWWNTDVGAGCSA